MIRRSMMIERYPTAPCWSFIEECKKPIACALEKPPDESYLFVVIKAYRIFSSNGEIPPLSYANMRKTLL